MTNLKPTELVPDPRRIATRRDFGAELTVARQRARLSVRQVATRVDVPASTLGGYFAGTHLPALQPSDLLDRILEVMGIEPAEYGSWWDAYWHVRGASSDESSDDVDYAIPSRATVSTRAPLDRLLAEPTLRGRDGLVRRLNGVVSRGSQLHAAPRVHVLHGLGGCGKSMVAMTVAKYAATQGIEIFWITAQDRMTTITGMRALAARIAAARTRPRGASLPDDLWRELRERSTPWLLVIDNADDPVDCLALPGKQVTDGTGWLRAVEPGLGTVIVTTRDGDTATWSDTPPAWLQLHRLSGLRRDHGAQLLAELAGDTAGALTGAGDLSDRLGGLPLALMLAGRYLAESVRIPAEMAEEAPARTYTQYCAALERGNYGDLFATTPTGDRSRTTIAKSWRISLDLLATRGVRHARPLLNTLACFGVGPIPYAELLRADTLALTRHFPAIVAHDVWRTLQALEGLGLIALSNGADDPPMLDMHPLARDLARNDSDVSEHGVEYLATAVTVLATAIADASPKLPTTWDTWRTVAAHCLAVLNLLDANSAAQPDVVDQAIILASRAAQYFRAAGRHEEAEAAFGAVLRVCDARLDRHDPTRLDIEHNLARLRYDQGRYSDAEQLYRSVLAGRESRLGAEHPDTLTTRYYLGRTLRTRNQLPEAAVAMQQTYHARNRILGERHPDTLTSRHGLADVLRAEGAHAQAADLYAQILSARQAVLGAEHPAALTTGQYYAEMLHKIGQSDQAQAQLWSLWATNQRVRGLDHPRTLAVGHALIDVLHDSSHFEDAARLADTVLACYRQVFGPVHPRTMAVRHRRGLIRSDHGDLYAAVGDLTAVLADRTQVLGPDHPQTKQSAHALDAVQRRIAVTGSPPSTASSPPPTEAGEMMTTNPEDELDPEIARVLKDWAALHNRHILFHHWLVNGRSRQPVAVVRDTDLTTKESTLLVMKIMSVRGESVRDLEYRRHHQAESEAPEFARAHLSTFVHQAIPVPGRRWITFQRIAGMGLERTEVLTVLLHRMLRISTETEPSGTAHITCDPATFAEACQRLVGGVLRDWAMKPYTPPGVTWTVASFLTGHLSDQLEPGGRLSDWVQRHQGEQIQLKGERGPLPNPFAVAAGKYFGPDTIIRPFVGPCHGDLHTDNALVRVRPSIDTTEFYLIDTALYEAVGPLTRDPVHLVLYIIARSMEAIGTEAQQSALIELLLDPVSGPAPLVPGWLAMIIQQVDSEAIAWVEPHGLAPEWREQTYLSIAACALLFLGRTSTRAEDKPWFLRLAARAVERFAQLRPDARLVQPDRSEASTVSAAPWIGWLCRDLPDVQALAARYGKAHEAETFRAAALSGLDQTEQYRGFVRELGGPDPDVRFGTLGSEGRTEPEEYLCPLELCVRRERRVPGGEKPVCHLGRESSQPLRSSIE